MKLLLASLLAGSATAFTQSSFNGNAVTQRVATKASMSMETAEDLAVLAKKCNPVVGFYDPLGLATQKFWDTTDEETIGFLREAEIKHGRIAMFAFVGYIVHANGIHFPWAMQMDGTPFPSTTNAPEAWDSISDAAKYQIFAFVGFLEVVSTLLLCMNPGLIEQNFGISHLILPSNFFHSISGVRLCLRSTT